ncbi:polyketide synthase 5 [Mycolicibacterium sp. 624]
MSPSETLHPWSSAPSASSPTAHATPVTPVAVIGMACRLPGGIDSPEQLWESLLRGDDLVTEIPADRWDSDDYYDPEPGMPGRSVSKWGAFLDDVAGFDFEFFGINEREATACDPQHRLLLETSWEAMEHAGMTRHAIADTLTGVFVGLTHADYQLLAADAHAVEGPYGFTGNNFSLASGRVAHALGTHGPALTVDTACSSGLTAVHLACRSLHEQESELALAGGATLILDPRKWASGSAAGMLSPTGRCHAFDIAEDGFVPGEGCVVIMLKRLPDAQRDGDRILAVIRGTAVNQDGHTVNIATPSRPAQVAAYREALAAAGVDPASVGMVETHGTGTAVGDPIEYASLAEVYGLDGPCALAAVKTNFGHTQSASGVLGLMKAVLALQHGVIPQNLHFTRLPDAMAQIETNLFVPQATTPWPTPGHTPRRAAVSSYGVSGTNVHAVLEQAPEIHDTMSSTASSQAPMLFPLSSTSAEELRRSAGRMADWLQRHDDVALPDLTYTLARRRVHRPVRTAVIASTRSQLTEALRGVADGDTPYRAAVGDGMTNPVWVFSGQGSQWPAMGAQLLETEPVFAATVAQAEPLIARESGFSVTDALSRPQMVTGEDRTQPTLFTIQVGLAATMRAYGVRPGAVIGHSLGEAAAAVVAGALSLEDGVRLVCRRSRLMSRVAGGGAAATVELPAKQVLSELTSRGVKDAVVAVVTSPQSTVIAGAREPVHDLVVAWEQRQVTAHEISVDTAPHSPQVDPILDELTDALSDLCPMAPEVPFYSATLFDPREQPVCDAAYWVTNTRRMVRFATAVQAALEDGHRIFAELAPHPLLTRALEQTAHGRDMPLTALSAMRREQVLPHGLLEFVADVHSAGGAVDFSMQCPSGRLVDAPLPTWTHRRLWLSQGDQQSPTHGGHTVAVHPLLGSHVRLQEEPERHVWQADVSTASQTWLADYQIHGVAVLPGAAYCEMALAAARTVLGEASEVRDIRFEQPLSLGGHTTVDASASLSTSGVIEFTVETNRESEHARHATAGLHAALDEQPRAHDTFALLASHPHREDGNEVRKRVDQHGVSYGTAFTGLTAVYTGEGQIGTVLAEVALPRSIRSERDAYGVHPALLDACFQSVEAHPHIQTIGGDVLGPPSGVRRLRAYGSARNAHYCYTRVTSTDDTGIEADIEVLDEHGFVLLAVQGLRFGTRSEQVRRDRTLAEGLLTIEWQQRTPPVAEYADAGSWLLISTSATEPDAATALTDALKVRGAQCDTLHWPKDADHASNGERLMSQLRSGGFAGVVILTGGSEPRTDCDAGDQRLQSSDYVRHLVHITRELPAIHGELPHLYVVTRNAHSVLASDIPNLEQAGLRGLIRVVSAEYPHLGATQIDVDAATDSAQLAQQLLSGSEEDETAWRDGNWYIARLRTTPLRPEERRNVRTFHDRDGMRMQILTPGDLTSMEIVACERIQPGPGQIEVAVTASSVNIADVLVAAGSHPDCDGQLPALGTDFAGVVTALGPDVIDHQVGDHVGGLSPDGCWGTFVTCDARLAVKLPPGLADDQAAAVTTAHATAWYGLHNLAHIEGGDKVLIHSATGGVGQAAIAVARAAGADIFATADSAGHRQLLHDMGIEHVYDSHSVDFADQIRRETAGYGIDIVLNSAIGSAQRAGFELLALGGRFVDISQRDSHTDTRLELSPFRRNLSFYGLDLGLMSVSHPGQVQESLRTVYRLTADGVLPMPERTHYPLADAAAALHQMSTAQHTGKLVLDIPHAGRSDVVLPPEQVRAFRRDGAYIITGGLGDLGLFFAQRLAAGGCGRIVLTSRSEPDQKTMETIEFIRATGAEVVVECGDVGEPETAQRAVAAATGSGLPVRGVLHAASVIDDATLTNITDDLLEQEWAPKVHGAWNLHVATVSQPLDWFCSFSSVAGLVGSSGRGAYAAANSWLDAFTMWRRTQGLPATAIAWGAWAQIGHNTAAAHGADVAIAPDDGAYAFEALLRHDRPCTGYAQVVGKPWLATFPQHSAFTQALRSTGQNSTGSARLRAQLTGLPPDEWPSVLRHLIADQAGLILRRSIDPDRALSEYGLDSLGALELRTRVETETGVRISTTDITTVHDLADLLCERLVPVDATCRVGQ